MSSRPHAPWCRRLVATAALLLPLAASAASVACADSPPAAFGLSIGSGVATRDGKESRIEIHAHADGCVAVHRPWFLRDAGEYELRLDAREWAALHSAVAPEQLGQVDQRRLAAQTDTTWKDASSGTVVHADLDTDTITLQWRDGNQSHQLVTRNPQQAAARQAKSAELSRVAAAVGALRALATRPGKRVDAEGTP